MPPMEWAVAGECFGEGGYCRVIMGESRESSVSVGDVVVKRE